ncbi:MAG: flagellar FliJ family protein [Oceanococcaceae bacterium]
MKPHTLKTLRQIRLRAQDHALQNWSDAQAQTARHQHLAQQLGQARSGAAAPDGATASARELSLRQGFAHRLDAVAVQAHARVQQARQHEDVQQREFQEARREMLILDTLEERERRRMEEWQRQQEQQMLEEFVSARHGR